MLLGKSAVSLVCCQKCRNSSATKCLNSSLLGLERDASSKALTRPSTLLIWASKEKLASFASGKPYASTRATLPINDDALIIVARDMDDADNFLPGKKLNTAIRPEISRKTG